MDGNPWQVESIHEFYFLKCPECDYSHREEQYFQNHAVENHPLSFVLFGKSENNQIQDSGLKINFLETKPIPVESTPDLLAENMLQKLKEENYSYFFNHSEEQYGVGCITVQNYQGTKIIRYALTRKWPCDQRAQKREWSL